MKKLLILLFSLTFVFAFEMQPKNFKLKYQGNNSKSQQTCKHKLEIVSVKIVTDSTGAYKWIATIKNLGPGKVCDPKHISIQGYQYVNSKKYPASGRVLTKQLKKNETEKVFAFFNKKCNANKFELDIFEKSKIKDKKTKNFPKLKNYLRIKNIKIDKQNNTWQAQIQNTFTTPIKIIVQGYALVNNTWKPAGGTEFVASGTKYAPSLHYSGSATKLKVVLFKSCEKVGNNVIEKITEKIVNIK